MTRLLATSGDCELAKRTLRLYIQVVSKAREAASSGGIEAGTIIADSSSEYDTDRLWVQTLVQGSRMLCCLAVEEPDYGMAVELAKEAGVVLQKARSRLDEEDKELVASIYLAEGIWHSVTAYAGTCYELGVLRITQSPPRAKSQDAVGSAYPFFGVMEDRCWHISFGGSAPPSCAGLGPTWSVQRHARRD